MPERTDQPPPPEPWERVRFIRPRGDSIGIEVTDYDAALELAAALEQLGNRHSAPWHPDRVAADLRHGAGLAWRSRKVDAETREAATERSAAFGLAAAQPWTDTAEVDPATVELPVRLPPPTPKPLDDLDARDDSGA